MTEASSGGHDAGMVIETHGLTKTYGEVQAVRSLDLAVARGSIFGFLGPNGAGKSTTIQMLCTLVKPTAGSAFVAGHDVVADPAAVRSAIGLVFQDPSLDGILTARENLDFHGLLYNVPRAVRRSRADEVLEMVDLTDRASSLVKTFSGGMKRRLEIARGVYHTPEVLFLDEPTQGLDPQTRAKMWEYITALPARTGTTVFMTTHYMDEAEYCDRIAVIDRGSLVTVGTPDELRAQVGGDVITIATADDSVAAGKLRAMGLEPTATRSGLRVETSSAGVLLPRIVSVLGEDVRDVNVRRPSLDDVFIKLTGHEIREEGAEGFMRQAVRVWGGRR